MPTTTIRSPPSEADFTPLSEYQAQTPETFFGGKPVLYYHATGAKSFVSKDQCGTLPVFPTDSSALPSGPEAAALGVGAEDVTEQKLDIWVNSENLTLFNQEAQVGVTIDYPTISIHALKPIGSEGDQIHTVWLQMELGDGGRDDDDFNTVELTIVPPANGDQASQGEAKRLFEAVSSCSNLHPDPVEEGDEDEDEDDRIVFESNHEFEALAGFTGVMRGTDDGGLPPPMPGSSGWITAENVHEYFDEEGNWIGEEGASGELGDGAGRVRNREEANADNVNGEAADEDSENKRPRVE
ncbi:hypothetical protein jhhlp_002463 [Lomentospora prolificans]|uniref:Protein LOT5 n=1 Tax=Lomentospora prolificans TaxID=41688 RepID=A0A2N3NE01_9PEZI|nr:hypothetical protein jhhlp_002463 [Lomentospora prolificans]